MAGTDTSDPSNPFVDELADAIETRFGSRAAFCERAGIDHGGLSRILARQTDASKDVILKTAEAMGWDPSETLLRAYMLGKARPGLSDDVARYNRISMSLTEIEKGRVLDVMELLAIQIADERKRKSTASGAAAGETAPPKRRRRGAKPA